MLAALHIGTLEHVSNLRNVAQVNANQAFHFQEWTSALVVQGNKVQCCYHRKKTRRITLESLRD